MNRQAIRTASCLALLLALVLTCGNALADTMASAEANAADSRLEKLMDQFWDAELASRPLTANMFGSPDYRDRLPDLSEEAFADRRRRLDTALETLQGIDMIDLSEANRINYRIFEWMLRKERRTLDFDWQYVTFNTMGGQHSLFAEVVLALPYRSETDFRALLTRLEGFGALIDQTIALEKKGIESAYVQPCEVLDGHADSIIGWATERPEDSAFYSLFEQMPETLDWARREELRSAAKRARSPVSFAIRCRASVRATRLGATAG